MFCGSGLSLAQIAALAGSGGGAGGYHADAVHFGAGSNYLNGPLSGTDTATLGMATFLKSGRDLTISASGNVLCAFQADDGPTVVFGSETHPGALYVSMGNVAGDKFVQWRSTDGFVLDQNWHSVVVGVDTSDANTANWKVAARLDRTAVTFVVDEFGGPVGPGPLLNAICVDTMWVPDFPSPGKPCDNCNLLLWNSTSLLTGGAISDSTLNLFVTADNKPVDPAVAIGSLGNPVLYLTGDASTFGTNLGTGGDTLVLTGSMTNASTSPSD